MNSFLTRAVLIGVMLSGCTPKYLDKIGGEHEHPPGETLFLVGFDSEGNITSVTNANGEPAKRVDRAEHDRFISKREEIEPGFVVKRTPTKNPPEEIILHRGSDCHDMPAGGTTHKDCH